MQTTHLLLTLLLVAATVTLRSNARDLVDVDGGAVQPGVEYFMVSARGGVLPVKYPGGSSCASYIGWTARANHWGVPVIINSVNSPKAESIAVGENVYIQFSYVDSCVKTPYWTLADTAFVAVGGTRPVVPPPKPKGRSDNMFSFRSGGTNNTFGLSFCPCNLCRTACFDIGKSSVNGRRILGVGSGRSDFTVAFVAAQYD